MGSLVLWQAVDLSLKRRVMQKDIFKVSTFSVLIVISKQDRGKTLQATLESYIEMNQWN